MNKNKFLPLVGLAAMAALTGCDENAWNDKLDGFDSKYTPTQVERIDYTLTDADYAAIASNKDNKAKAEADGVAQALAALSGNKYFTDVITAADYVPAFLASTSSPFYTLTDGSAINLTYKVAVGLPKEVTEAPGARMITVDEDFYAYSVWGSDENYIPAFAPEKPASRYLASYLKSYYDDAVEGDYAYVTYSEATTNPIFGGVDADEPKPGFEMSDVISGIDPDQDVDIMGVVSGVCTSGFTLTDLSGTIFVYMGSAYDAASNPIGTQLHLVGNSTSYKNNLQIAAGAEITVMGQQAYTFPTPEVLDGAAMDEILTRDPNVLAEYARVSGTVAVNGNNINIVVDGAETAQGSIYYATDEQKAFFTDGKKVSVEGWIISISGSRYINFVVTDYADLSTRVKPRANRTVAAPVPTVEKIAFYQFNGSQWVVPEGFVVLQPSDYVDMGRTGGNIAAPAEVLPTFLKMKFPYAQKDDSKFVVYNYYSSSSAALACSNYVYDGSQWILNNGVETEQAQFVRANGKWMYDPNVTINLPYGRNQAESMPFYQACVDWVYENKCVPLGDTSIKSGKFWVTSYGNNDYYCGTSAYQSNVDLRAASARAQYAAGWDGYTDEEIIATEEERCEKEVFPAVLSQFYPEAKPIDGLQIIYTLNFYAYIQTPDGKYKTLPCWAKYEVTGKGEFTYVDSEWVIGFND